MSGYSGVESDPGGCRRFLPKHGGRVEDRLVLYFLAAKLSIATAVGLVIVLAL